MALYILRHGIAVELGEPGAPTDADRRLSQAGKRKTHLALAGLGALGCTPERIVSSPLPRAWETADIAVRELRCRAEVEPCDLLKPGMRIAKTRSWVAENDAGHDMMIVGHQPGLARLVSYLVAGDDRVEIVLKKSAVCRLSRTVQRQGAPYRLDWLLQPRQLRALGKTKR